MASLSSHHSPTNEEFSFVEQFAASIPPHQFNVDGVTYEWMDGAYYKHVSDINQGKSFGELALMEEDFRKATIKCESQFVHFATL